MKSLFILCFIIIDNARRDLKKVQVSSCYPQSDYESVCDKVYNQGLIFPRSYPLLLQPLLLLLLLRLQPLPWLPQRLLQQLP